jgi:hypothetical protein
MARKIINRAETQENLESGSVTVQHLKSWSNKIEDPSKRFLVLPEFNDEAVLDRETQLVWERKPSTTTLLWQNARFICAQKVVGGRGGWRLPCFYELSSLVDPSVTDASIPRLPPGHPFQDVEPHLYWSSTAVADEPGFAFGVDFGFRGGSDAPILVTDINTDGQTHCAWCVRGGSPGPDTY